MAAIAFDPLEYSRMLEDAGVPRDQAEVHAKAMTAAFLHNVDALVTKDYLDVCFKEFESRLDARLEGRFSAIDRQFDQVASQFERVASQFGRVDSRFDQVDSRFERVEARLGHLEDRMDKLEQRMDRLETRMDTLEHRVDQLGSDMAVKFARLYVMMGITMIAVTYPALERLLASVIGFL